MGIRGWLKSLGSRRRSERISSDALTAYYWTGGVPKPMDVRDISLCGAYIVSSDNFYPATMMQVAFENRAKGDATICVCAQVSRQTQDGFCVSFLFSDFRERRLLWEFLKGVKRKDLGVAAALVLAEPPAAPSAIAEEDTAQASETERPAIGEADGKPGVRLRKTDIGIEGENGLLEADQMADGKRVLRNKKRRGGARGSSGQALIELALILPLLFLLIVNVINFGGLLYAWITVSNAARAGAQYTITGAATLGAPARPSDSAVQTLVMNDLYALRNATTSQVCVSTSLSSTVSCNTGTAPSSAPPPAETAEGSPAVTFAVAAVDVTYTYSPFIPLWSFPKLNIHATLTPTSIHRQAVMRILQ